MMVIGDDDDDDYDEDDNNFKDQSTTIIIPLHHEIPSFLMMIIFYHELHNVVLFIEIYLDKAIKLKFKYIRPEGALKSKPINCPGHSVTTGLVLKFINTGGVTTTPSSND